VRIEVGLPSSRRVFSEMRAPSALGRCGALGQQVNFPRTGGASRSSVTRIFGRTATRIFGSGSCWDLRPERCPAGLGRIVKVASDDFSALTTSSLSRCRRRRASKRRSNCRWSFKAAFAVCSRRTPLCPPLAAAARSHAPGSIDDLYVVRSYLNDWQDGRPSTWRTVEGLGWTESPPLAHDWSDRYPWPGRTQDFETAMLLGFLRKTIESTGLRCRLPALTARVWMTHQLRRPCEASSATRHRVQRLTPRRGLVSRRESRDFPKSWLPETPKTRKHYRRGLFRSS
jgi:hypothetical protein